MSSSETSVGLHDRKSLKEDTMHLPGEETGKDKACLLRSIWHNLVSKKKVKYVHYMNNK